MTKQELFDIKIESPDRKIYEQSKYRWDHLSKPIDGMGDFEELICQIASIQGSVFPSVDDRVLLVFCSDNGIVSRKVTQSGQDVTSKIATALGQGKSTACMLARSCNTKVVPVDVGINSSELFDGVLDRKITMGTNDFLTTPAMCEEQALRAIEAGVEVVSEQVGQGAKLIATGEMGIGNTTTSAAVLAALLDIDSAQIVGRGAGLDDAGLLRKQTVVKDGIAKYEADFASVTDVRERALLILGCLGGYDIAAMCGAFIGCAVHRIPVIIDGAISAVAALLADIFANGARDYMIASHSGREQATKLVLDKLGKSPYINGKMALGEGTGALMLIPLIDQALYLYQNGLGFADAGIEDYERFA